MTLFISSLQLSCCTAFDCWWRKKKSCILYEDTADKALDGHRKEKAASPKMQTIYWLDRTYLSMDDVHVTQTSIQNTEQWGEWFGGMGLMGAWN